MLRNVIVAAALLLSACSGALHIRDADHRVGGYAEPPACRAPAATSLSTDAVRWIEADNAKDRSILDEWCRSVGPAVIVQPAAATVPPHLDQVSVVSWNVDVGGGDLDALLESARGHPLVVLVQEAYRDGALVPRLAPAAPARIAPSPPSGHRRSIVETARRHGLALFYVPSMRNGRGVEPDGAEDRGNAILSTLPLLDFTAIELPFEHQRRVAVAARVRVRDATGVESMLQSVSAHVDVQSSWQRGRFLWFGRVRQTRALLAAVAGLPDPKILGGDFNSWLGENEPGVREARNRFPQTPAAAAHVTFPLLGRLGFHLDHLFFRLPPGWTAAVSRIDDRWGSDHYPLVASLKPN